MADEIVAPGVTCEVWPINGELRYIGEYSALQAAGVVPAECPNPRATSGGRGVRWTDAQGRKWRLIRWQRAPMLKAYRVPSKHERAAAVKEYEARRRADWIREALTHRVDDDRQLRGSLIAGVREMERHIANWAWADSPNRGPWSVTGSDRNVLEQLFAGLRGVMLTIQLDFNAQWRPKLESELALLDECHSTDSRVHASAAAVIDRARLGRRSAQ